MTVHTSITLGCSNEASRETAMSQTFSSFLPIFADYIETQQDLEDINRSYDPSFSLWDRDAKVACAHFTGELQQLLDLPVQLPEDRPLQRFAMLIDAMLDDEEASRPRRLHRQMQFSFFTHYQVPGFEPMANYRNMMLIRARHLVDAMARLSLFDFSPDEIDDDSDVEEPPTSNL